MAAVRELATKLQKKKKQGDHHAFLCVDLKKFAVPAVRALFFCVPVLLPRGFLPIFCPESDRRLGVSA